VRVTDAVAYSFLQELERTGDEAAALDFVATQFPADQVVRLLDEIASLKDAGLLRGEESAGEDDRNGFVGGLAKHHPRNLMLLVTDSCNLKCFYCYEVTTGFHAKSQLSTQDAVAIVDEYLAATGPRKDVTITFFGGEPLVNFPAIRRTVEHACARGRELGKRVGFTITTNATLLTDDIADFLVQHRFGVMVSIDGDEEAHNRWRVDKQGRGTHEKVVAGIRLLLAKQLAAGVQPVKLRATMTSTNFDRDKIAAYLRSIGDVRIMVGASTGTAFEKATDSITEVHQEEIFQRLDAAIEDILQRASNGRAPPRDSHVVDGLQKLHAQIRSRQHAAPATPNICGVGRNMLAITPKGDYFPCHRYVGMPAWQIGSRRDGGVDQNRLQTYYKRIYDSFQEHCTKCWMRFRCGGQCPWYLSTPDGEVVHPDEASCRGIRTFEERLVWLYATLLDRHPKWLGHIVRDIGVTAADEVTSDEVDGNSETARVD
jgi:uncharacterized protein